MAGIIYLDIDDEITSAATRIRDAKDARVALVLFFSAYPRFHDTLSGLVPPLSLAILVAAAIRTSRTSPARALPY